MSKRFLLVIFCLAGILGISVFLILFIVNGIFDKILSEPPQEKSPEKHLLVAMDTNSIKQIYTYNNSVIYEIWVWSTKIDEKKLNNFLYLGKTIRIDDYRCFSLDNRRYIDLVMSAHFHPKWWKVQPGYFVYQLEKSDRNHPPHIVCTVLVSPDGKDVYVYQNTNTRKN